ncbi:hypothetical protein TWF694_001603 [Orbilia ellipsospora]|uniref:Peptidase A1 domain-containing protein n=1 Tax=Orbilia ellipsospora TaxID=2528407 RepID=A0AAV9X439_9PEZI
MRLISLICLAVRINPIGAFVPWRIDPSDLDPASFHLVSKPRSATVRRHESTIDNIEAKFKRYRRTVETPPSIDQQAITFPLVARNNDKSSGPIILYSDPDDISYWVNVQFGSSNKPFRLVLDTGSADTWIPSSGCISKSCIAHSTFGASDSSTLQLLNNNKTFSIEYASGNVEGVIIKDSMTLGPMALKDVEFGLANTVSDDFTTFPVDGILGLGFPSASVEKVPTFLDNLVSQNIVSKRVFGVYLQRTADGLKNGSVIFGTVDSSRIDGGADALKYYSLNGTGGLWSIRMDDVVIDNQNIDFGGRSVIIDTGTALILIPPNDALKLHQHIPGTKSNGETFYIPCDTQLSLEFQFGNDKYSISFRDYVGAKIDSAGTLCLSLIVGRSVVRDGAWLIGDVFLRNVYSVFDMDNLRIGLGMPLVIPNPSGTTTTTSKPTSVLIPTSILAPQGINPPSQTFTNAPEVASTTSAPITTSSPSVASSCQTFVVINWIWALFFTLTFLHSA